MGMIPEVVEDEIAGLVEKIAELSEEIRYLKYLVKSAGNAKTMTLRRYNEITDMAKSLADGHFESYYPNQHCGNACVTVDDRHVAEAMMELLAAAVIEPTAKNASVMEVEE